jgi:hypothetical protein
MSYRHTLEAALEGLHEIENLITGFPSEGNIPDIELDLALQKLRNSYELLLMLKKEEAVTLTGTIADEAAITAPGKKTEGKVTIGETAPVAAHEAIHDVAVTSTDSPRTIADQFKGKTTLHESLHQTLGAEESTLAHAKPVTHLMTAIGINDRFTLIRELFNNDAQAFESTIGKLNDAASFNDAYNHMIQHFDWDMDSEVVQQLLDIIRRKFIKGRHE